MDLVLLLETVTVYIPSACPERKTPSVEVFETVLVAQRLQP
jgi:hypothetical protein